MHRPRNIEHKTRQCFCGWDSALNHISGAYSAPRPPSWIWGG